MSVAYEATGRRRQKERTRAALLVAVRELLAEQEREPTVEQAAEAAGVSRATAYRYFPTRRALLLAAHPEFDIPTLLDEDAPSDPAERLERTVDGLMRLTLEHETALRTMLRLSLAPAEDDELVLRQGRAIGWIRDALTPLEGTLSESELHRLALAIRAACGIEALVWLTDVGGLDRPQAADLMRWSSRSLLAAALPEPRAG